MILESTSSVAVQFAVPVVGISYDEVVEWVELARGDRFRRGQRKIYGS